MIEEIIEITEISRAINEITETEQQEKHSIFVPSKRVVRRLKCQHYKFKYAIINILYTHSTP